MVGRIRKRIPVLLDGELISNRGNYDAIINNISENGIYAKIPLNEREKNHSLDLDFFSLKLQLPTGDLVNLNCTKKWSYHISPGSLIEHIGIEVINPPQQYKKLFKNLIC
jgi:hypothetical protein